MQSAEFTPISGKTLRKSQNSHLTEPNFGDLSRHAGYPNSATPLAAPVLQVLWCQLTQFLPPNAAIGPEKDAERQAALGIAQGCGQRSALQTRQPHRKSQGLAAQETPHGRRLIDGQSQHLKAVGSVFTPESVDHGQFFDAGRAPGGPEIDQQRPSAQARRRNLAALGPLEALLPKGVHFGRFGAQPPPGQPSAGQGRGSAHPDQQGPPRRSHSHRVHADIVTHLSPISLEPPGHPRAAHGLAHLAAGRPAGLAGRKCAGARRCAHPDPGKSCGH